MIKFKLSVFVVSFVLLASCATDPAPKVYEESVEITELNPDRLTHYAKQNIFHLAKVYDLAPFLFTKKMNLQTGVNSTAHPTLTLNTKYAERPPELLAVWMHEEMQWWMKMHPKAVNLTINQLGRLIPGAPLIGKSNRPAYNRLLICYLEYRTVEHVLGTKEANRILSGFINRDKRYPWAYSQVLKNKTNIGRIVTRNKLLPPPIK